MKKNILIRVTILILLGAVFMLPLLDDISLRPVIRATIREAYPAPATTLPEIAYPAPMVVTPTITAFPTLPMEGMTPLPTLPPPSAD